VTPPLEPEDLESPSALKLLIETATNVKNLGREMGEIKGDLKSVGADVGTLKTDIAVCLTQEKAVDELKRQVGDLDKKVDDLSTATSLQAGKVAGVVSVIGFVASMFAPLLGGR